MMDRKIVSADLVIAINVECPECGQDIDLAGHERNDEGWVYEQTIADKAWRKPPEDRLELDNFECPHCAAEFTIRGVNW